MADGGASMEDDFENESSDEEVRAAQRAADAKKPPQAAKVAYRQERADINYLNAEQQQFAAPAGGSKQYRGDSILKVKSQIEYGEE